MIESYEAYLRERTDAYQGLSGSRLLREIEELSYEGDYAAVTDFLRAIRLAQRPTFELRFETPPGRRLQVDFAQFRAEFTDEPGVTRIVLRNHIDALGAMKGAPSEDFYDRMKTTVIDEDADTVRSSITAFSHSCSAITARCPGLVGRIGRERGENSSIPTAYPAGLLSGQELPLSRGSERSVRSLPP